MEIAAFPLLLAAAAVQTATAHPSEKVVTLHSSALAQHSLVTRAAKNPHQLEKKAKDSHRGLAAQEVTLCFLAASSRLAKIVGRQDHEPKNPEKAWLTFHSHGSP
jgi:hypothetical protein